MSFITIYNTVHQWQLITCLKENLKEHSLFIKIYINRATPSVKSTTKIYIFTDTVNHTLLSSLVYKGILSHFSVVVLIHLIGMNSAPEVGNHCSENRNCNVDSGIRNHFTPEKKPLKESKTLHQE